MVGKQCSPLGLPRPACYKQPSKRKGTRHRRTAARTSVCRSNWKMSVAGVLVAHRQWIKRIVPGPIPNQMTNNMGHSFRHAIIILHRPFTVQDFDQH